ncbi:MAG: type II CAAX endopeptidase family protein [Candidatus Methanomethylicaceae archaeon]
MMRRLSVFLLLTGVLVVTLRLAFGKNLAWGSLVFLLFASAVCWLMVRFFDRRPLSSLGLSLYRGLEREILAGIALGAILGFAHYGTLHILGIQPIAATHSVSLGKALAMFGILFVTATGEEMLFRGYLLQTLLQRWGHVPAIVFSSAAFAMMHYFTQSWLEMCGTLTFGAMLSVACLRTRSLWLSIGVHTAWNLTGMYVAAGAVFSGAISNEFAVDSSYIFWMLVGLLIMIVLPLSSNRKAQELWETYIQTEVQGEKR